MHGGAGHALEKPRALCKRLTQRRGPGSGRELTGIQLLEDELHLADHLRVALLDEAVEDVFHALEG